MMGFDLGSIGASLGDLFNGDFMKQFTNCESITDFFKKGNFNISSLKDIKSISPDALNNLISQNSQFSNWQEMLGKATESLTKGKLGNLQDKLGQATKLFSKDK